MADEQGPLVRAYGRPARLKIVDTLLANPDRTYNVRELANAANIDESTVHTHKDFLLDLGILERVPLGRVDGYTLATETDLAQIGQQWRDHHQQRLNEMNLETTEAIAEFYGIESN